MEFVEVKSKEQKIYTIVNNLNNKYIIQFLTLYGLINSVTDNLITFEVDSIEFLRDNVILSDKLDTKFIYDIGYQLTVLKENKLGVKYFTPSDIVIINSNIFLFINPNMLFELLNKKHIAISKVINSYEYGIVERNSVDLNSKFIAPELLENSDYVYYTCSFYSFAKLFQTIFNFDVEDVEATSVYYFLQRCLEKKSENRIFLYV
jgi:hypothetical protein